MLYPSDTVIKEKTLTVFNFLIVHLLPLLHIFLVIVVCTTPPAMLIFLAC